jgi:hypothetical protein
MKKQFVMAGIAVLLICVGLSGCSGPTQLISAHKLDTEVASYVNMTEQQIEKFPHLKEAVLNNKSVETPLEEFNEVRGILEFEDTNFIKYQNEYYEIHFAFAD